MYIGQGEDVRRENRVENLREEEIIDKAKFGQMRESGIKRMSRGINLGIG